MIINWDTTGRWIRSSITVGGVKVERVIEAEPGPDGFVTYLERDETGDYVLEIDGRSVKRITKRGAVVVTFEDNKWIRSQE